MIESRFSLSLAAAFIFAGLAFTSTTNAEEALKGSAHGGKRRRSGGVGQMALEEEAFALASI